MIRKNFIGPLLLGVTLAISGCASFTSTQQTPVGERSSSVAAQDDVISSHIFQALGKTDARFNDAHVNVDVWNGYVLLTGQVPSQELKDKAVQIANNTAHVRKVQDELTIAANTSTTQRMQDSWLTTRITTNFMTSKEIDSDRVHVITENGVVYLMGMVRHDEAPTLVNTAGQISGVNKIVKVFEYID